MLKVPHNYNHLTRQQSNAQISPSQTSQYVNTELPDIQAGFRRDRGTKDQIADICCIIRKVREFQKNIFFIDYAKTFDCVDHNKLWIIFQEMGIPDHLTCFMRNLCSSRSNTQSWTWKNRLVPNRERSMSRVYIVLLLISIICRVHLVKC